MNHVARECKIHYDVSKRHPTFPIAMKIQKIRRKGMYDDRRNSNGYSTVLEL